MFRERASSHAEQDRQPPAGLIGPALPGAAVELALYSSVPAGFPSPAEDYVEGALDVHALLVRRPAATFFCRAQGPSMRDAGIHDGDLLVVDRSLEPLSGDIVVATIEGGLTVKRLRKTRGGWVLEPANPDFPSIPINPDAGITVWGVVTFSITGLCAR
ncbi:LexA family transcriptional regulator [Telmatospirillum sp. J64-1]|uniref:LexA family protein n=1 Tax=Telmatospirillum sp. J64-1 TaxID=2502183 RepID=UPI00115D7F51|nr:translesion error-prone DNA polymerase V autoproteolytic subunit [Telmatospirillum sp. J64-1]